MKKILGILLILFDVIAAIIIGVLFVKKDVYRENFWGFITDCFMWYGGLFIAILLLGLVLLKDK